MGGSCSSLKQTRSSKIAVVKPYTHEEHDVMVSEYIQGKRDISKDMDECASSFYKKKVPEKKIS